MARLIIFIGIALVIIGLIWNFFPRALSWFGNLPGDIKIQNENSSVFIPITSMIVVSVAFSLISNVLAWFFGNK